MAQTDSTGLRISILTCANGDQIYSAFGHSAIRVINEARRTDVVYNYGTFDYHQPLFALKFARGYLDYALTPYSFRLFSGEYIKGRRNVTEQKLNLTPAQAQAIYDFLEWNAREENRYYRYNFLTDNCATKIRDILRSTSQNAVRYPDTDYDFTLRQAINQRLEQMPWLRCGVSLLMGLPVDKKATSETAMFLPEYVFETLSNSQIDRYGNLEPLVSDSRVILRYPPVDGSSWLTYVSPSLILWLIFAAWGLATFYEVKNGRYSAWADRILLMFTGFLGVVVYMAWFMSEHTVCTNNLNILWLWPLHMVAAWYTRSGSTFWKYYFRTACIMCAALALAGPLMPQQWDISFYPMLMIMTLRFARIGFCRK